MICVDFDERSLSWKCIYGDLMEKKVGYAWFAGYTFFILFSNELDSCDADIGFVIDLSGIVEYGNSA